ncbi:ABC transporter ATP-binding protein [Brevibacterium zhoupengii]|uniref:ABC transporter ATP-binding protein n=1 Tax=Brevibacterium zhoupengii TaxID=2898795 RepID=UPI001E4176C6|nr:ATP-binding cassette domain-containing protein [Brevibacterium zhoupengii]
METAITTDQLTKRYGSRTAVADLNLRVPEGCVYGFLGPNGSGKSTTMKMLLSLVRPTAGEVRILGRPMTRQTRRSLLGQIGSLIESPPGYAHLTGQENMQMVGRLLDLPPHQIDWAVDTVHLRRQMSKRVRDYSLGMKQRLGIAMALARAPRVLILDEPTNGLDPAGIEEIRDLLRTLAEAGVTVMVSSHLLGEIDKTATVLGIVSDGRMIFQGSRQQLLAESTPDVLIRCSNPADARAAVEGLQQHPVLHDAMLRITNLGEEATARVVSSLVEANIDIFEVRRDEQSLEDIFKSLTAGAGL